MGLDDPLPPRGDVGHYAHEWTWEEQKIASTPKRRLWPAARSSGGDGLPATGARTVVNSDQR